MSFHASSHSKGGFKFLNESLPRAALLEFIPSGSVFRRHWAKRAGSEERSVAPERVFIRVDDFVERCCACCAW